MLLKVTNFPHGFIKRATGYSKLHVESLGGPLLLSVQHILLGLLEVFLGHLHPPLSESKKTSLSTDCLDVGSREIILRHDVLLKVNIFSQGHFPCVDAKDSTLGLLVWVWELNFPVNPARPNQSRVKGLNPIGCHDHLSVTACIKPIQLVEEFQHCPLDLSFSSAVAVVPFSPHRINLVNEYNGGTVLVCHPEQLPHQLGTVSKVFLDQLASNHSEEGCASLVGNSLCQQGLAGARGAVQDHPLGWLDPHLLVVFWMGERQLH